MDRKKGWKPDIIVALSPTTPFRNSKHIDQTINLLIKTKSKAAITITEPSYSPYWMFKKEKKILNFYYQEEKRFNEGKMRQKPINLLGWSMH